MSGTITAYSTAGYEISPESRDGRDSLPHDEQWCMHHTLPAVDFFNIWTARYARLIDMLVPNIRNGPTTGTFHTRATDRVTGERLAKETSPLEEWRPNVQKLVKPVDDDQVNQRSIARWQHVVVS